MPVDPSRPPGIRIAQIYLASATFGHREDHLALPLGTALDGFKVQVSATVAPSTELTGAAFFLAVESAAEPKPLYSFRVELVALIDRDPASLPNFSPLEYAISAGPALLFPFAREVVANLTQRGRFGPLWLTPFNTLEMSKAMREAHRAELEAAEQALLDERKSADAKSV